MGSGIGEVRERSKARWFPLHFHLLQDLRFKSLGYRPTVGFVEVIHKMHEHLTLRLVGGRRGAYVMSDTKLASMVQMSVRLLRQARANWAAWGWIEVTPGYMSDGARVSTAYEDCKYAVAFPGLRIAIMHDLTWQSLIYSLHSDYLSHVDLAAAVWLRYLWQAYGGEEEPRVGVTLKDEDAEIITGMPLRTLLGSLRNLRNTEASGFSFELEHRHGVIEIRDFKCWNMFGENGPYLL